MALRVPLALALHVYQQFRNCSCLTCHWFCRSDVLACSCVSRSIGRSVSLTPTIRRVWYTLVQG